MSECIDPIVGKILAGWRYDISGIAPEMRSGYEEHFTACEHCRKWQRLHRTIDISLIAKNQKAGDVYKSEFLVEVTATSDIPNLHLNFIAPSITKLEVETPPRGILSLSKGVKPGGIGVVDLPQASGVYKVIVFSSQQEQISTSYKIGGPYF